MSFETILFEAVEQEFDEEFRNAGLVCTKEELLKYREAYNRHGKLMRPPNAPQIYAREFFKALRQSSVQCSGLKPAMTAWKELTPSKQHMFDKAAAIIKKKMADKYPDYKYEPNKPGKNFTIAYFFSMLLLTHEKC